MSIALAAALLGAAGMVACASGTAESGGYDPLPELGGSGPTTTSGHGGHAAQGGAAAGAGSGGEAGGGGSGGAAGQGTGAGGQGAEGGSCSFASYNNCFGAEVLPTIAGDDGSDVSTAQGARARWFKIFVEESVSSIIDYPPLSFTASLQSPAGTNYDLYVYFGDNGGTNCAAVPLQGGGSPETVHSSWGDNMGTDDGTWLSVEVRYVSGDDCASQWTLSIAGNT
jgi:hypothetical protein